MVMLPHDLKRLRRLFCGLETLQRPQLEGVYEGRFVGPLMARDVAPLGFALAGLRGWWGQAFDGAGRGHHLLKKGGEVERAVPLEVASKSSLVDGRESLVVSAIDAPRVMVEPRRLDDSRLLAMVSIRSRALRRLAWPYLLERVDSPQAVQTRIAPG
ncbi:MAG: hypothetical protein AAGE52_18200 [Myxococcota bacterium]